MKMAESWLFMDQLPPKHHRMFITVHKKYSEKLMPTLQKRPGIGHKNEQISAVYGPISSKPPQNVIFGSLELFCKVEMKKEQ